VGKEVFSPFSSKEKGQFSPFSSQNSEWIGVGLGNFQTYDLFGTKISQTADLIANLRYWSRKCSDISADLSTEANPFRQSFASWLGPARSPRAPACPSLGSGARCYATIFHRRVCPFLGIPCRQWWGMMVYPGGVAESGGKGGGSVR
jgi:hypothetical protein